MESTTAARLLRSEPSTHTHPLSLSLRRKADGFSRMEVNVYAGCRYRVNAFGEAFFVAYLSDDERRRLAATLLDGLPPESGP